MSQQALRSVGAVSCAKVFAVMYGFVGILIGAVFSLVFLFTGMAAGSDGLPGGMQSPVLSLFLGVGSILFFPICYALLGALGGLIMSGLYNLIAKYTGGIEIEIG